jgi:cathepsin L
LRFSSEMIRGALFLLLVVVAIEATRQSDDAHRSYGADSADGQTASKVSYWKSKPNKGRQYLYGSGLPPPGRRVSLNNYAYYTVWRDFKTTHNKSYDSTEEETSRFHVFVDNHRKIETHNREYEAGRKSFQLGMNKFGDMTNEEFRSHMNGYKRSLRDESNSALRGSTFLVPHNVLIPTEIDWRQKGYVTHVKDQGHCGSCWAFSAVGALEGQHYRKSGTMVELSEQNLVDCSATFGNEGCNGGLMDNAFKYIKANSGIDTETSYPYEALDGRCRFNKTNVGAEDSGFVDVASGDESQLEAALATVGPVSIAIDAGHESFQFYKKGVYNEPECSSEALDHGVLAVGYGVTPEGELFYIVKNSWNTVWGEDGYIRMSRRKQNQCGVATAASYPLV